MHVLEKGADRFPERVSALLGKRAPEKFFVIGNINLLDEHAISFCGARNASEKGIEAASLCARTAVKNNFVITSGNARGVDRATHREALACGGSTILVLPEGIDHFRIAPELKDVWDWERVLVISQFDPRAPWRAFQAMDRNKTIMALSCAMIVVEAGEKGGTRAAGEDALRLKIPLFAIDYGFDETIAPGNRVLIEKGAKRLKRSRDTGEPNLKYLLADASNFCATERRELPSLSEMSQGKLL